VNEAGTLIVTDIPDSYLTARGALICPMSLVTQTQLIAGMKRGEVHTFVLEPASTSMSPTARRELPALLNGVTAFLTSQEELRNLFWGETHDLWKMAEWVSMYGCEYVVIKCKNKTEMGNSCLPSTSCRSDWRGRCIQRWIPGGLLPTL
jgi:hypothetical protein